MAQSNISRMAAVNFIRQCYQTANMRVVSVDTPLLDEALSLYQAWPDKAWELTDCISFVVMRQQGLTDAVTADNHFTQAGYRALLLIIRVNGRAVGGRGTPSSRRDRLVDRAER